MAEATSEAEPAEDYRYVQLEDGSQLTMLPLTWAMLKASSQADPDRLDESLGQLMQAIEDAVVEAHFKNGRGLSTQPKSVFMQIFAGWRKAEDEAALPPVNGQPSETHS